MESGKLNRQSICMKRSGRPRSTVTNKRHIKMACQPNHLIPLLPEISCKAITLIIAEIPEVEIIIAGDGSQRSYLYEMVNSYNIQDRVRFIGKIPHKEMHKYLSLADVYVSTSFSDGASNSLLEAMSCGIARRSPCIRDLSAGADPIHACWIPRSSPPDPPAPGTQR